MQLFKVAGWSQVLPQAVILGDGNAHLLQGGAVLQACGEADQWDRLVHLQYVQIQKPELRAVELIVGAYPIGLIESEMLQRPCVDATLGDTS